jgi:uncharacterized phage protein (TIGR02218 family)
MRNISSELQAHLDSGTTTLCTCWQVTRQDGVVLGFTDHDRDLFFDDTLFKADSGGTASALQSSSDFSVDNSVIEGALNSESLTEEDFFAGLYDHAEVIIWKVNWAEPAQRLLMKKGTIGEVTRGKSGFTAELRSLSHQLDQPFGRVFQYGCDAVLGDARCTINLNNAQYTATGTVTEVETDLALLVSGLESFAADWFASGVVRFTSGQAEGLTVQVKSSDPAGDDTRLSLYLPVKKPVLVGDSFTITAGCDKQFSTCREKFQNGLNFRGMPHMPGNDFVTSYPLRGENNDGGKR